MQTEGTLQQFRDIKDVVSHYDAVLASIKSPQTVYNEGIAIIRDRVAELWASIATAEPDEREKLQENLLELGGQKKEMEINYKANIKRWEVIYQTRLKETMDEFRSRLAQLAASSTAQPEPRIQFKAQPQSQSQPPPGPQPQPGPEPQIHPQSQSQPEPQTILDDDAAEETNECRQTDNEPVNFDLVEDEPTDDAPHVKDLSEEIGDEIAAENERVEFDSTENDATESVPIKEEPVENEKLENVVSQEDDRDEDISAPPSPACDTITVGTSTMVQPLPKVEKTSTMSTRARESRNKRRAVSPVHVTNKRRKTGRAASTASAASTPDPDFATPAEESRRPTRQSHRRNQSNRVEEFQGITDPEPGRIYLTFWAKTKEWLAVLLLPMGDFNSVGIPGSITTCGLSESLPSCYRYNRTRKKYSWTTEYRDGMRLVNERMFPVIFFDGRDFPHKSAIMWIEAKNLRKFHMKLGSSLVPNRKTILKYLKQQGGRASSYGIEDEEVGRSERLSSHLSDIAEQEDSNSPEPTTAGPSNGGPSNEPRAPPANAGTNKQEPAPPEEPEAPAPETEPSIKIQRTSSTPARGVSYPRLSAILNSPFPMPSPPATPGHSRSRRRCGGAGNAKEKKPIVINISDDESEFDWDDEEDTNVGLTRDDTIDAPSESLAQDTEGLDTPAQYQAEHEESTVESQPAVITNQPTAEDEARAAASRIAQAALDHEVPVQDRETYQTGNTGERAPQERNSSSIGHLYLRSPSATNTSQSGQDYYHIYSQTRATSDSRPVSAAVHPSPGQTHPESQLQYQPPPRLQEPTPPQTSQPPVSRHLYFSPTHSHSIPPGGNAPAPEPVQGQEMSQRPLVNNIKAVRQRWEQQHGILAVDRPQQTPQQTYQQTTPTEYRDTQGHHHQARNQAQQLTLDRYWARHPDMQRAQQASQHQSNQQIPQQVSQQQFLAQQAQLYLQAQADRPPSNAQYPVQEENLQPSHEASQRRYFNHPENYTSNQTHRYPPPSSNLAVPRNSSHISQAQPPNHREQMSSAQAPDNSDQSYNPYSSIRYLSEYQDPQHAPVERGFHAQAAQQTAAQSRYMRNPQMVAARAYQGHRPPVYQPASHHRQARQYIQGPDVRDPRI
ncbi:hypothetical protein FAVG1_09456 [Fusarium avenaceum]|nr:hypothetical protein FAVG1_09456 [Fusarium avenaceum]